MVLGFKSRITTLQKRLLHNNFQRLLPKKMCDMNIQKIIPSFVWLEWFSSKEKFSDCHNKDKISSIESWELFFF